MDLLQNLYDNLTIAQELVSDEMEICFKENTHLNNLPELIRIINKMQLMIETSEEE
tara:strand:- start:52 stop:219 length:168 start_codon:yes stop_codon:yes gene_type:complete